MYPACLILRRHRGASTLTVSFSCYQLQIGMSYANISKVLLKNPPNPHLINLCFQVTHVEMGAFSLIPLHYKPFLFSTASGSLTMISSGIFLPPRCKLMVLVTWNPNFR